MISKSLIKKVALIGLIVAALGGIMALIGFCAAGCQSSSLYNLTKEQKVYTLALNDLTGIVMDMELSGIEVVVDEGSDIIKLEYISLMDKEGKEVNAMTIKSESGVFSVEEKSSLNLMLFNWDFLSIKAKLTIPDIALKILNLTTVNNALMLDEGVNADEIRAVSTNGEIAIKGVTTEAMNITNTNGKVSLNDVISEELSVRNTNGTVEIGNMTVDSVNVTTTNGKISSDGGMIEGKVIELNSTNGAISVKLKGESTDYSKTISNVNGSSNVVTEIGGSKSLKITNTNGSIKVSFEK